MSDYTTTVIGSTVVTALSNSVQPIAAEWIAAPAFWDRFTSEEMVSYDVSMQHDPLATNAAQRAAARLRIFRREASDAGRIKLGRQKVIDFVSSLEVSGVLAAGRAAAILTTPISEDEAA